jgi:ferrous iron transport protein A
MVESCQRTTLDLVPLNSKVKVLEIFGGWGIRQRLGQLGINPGDSVVVIRSGILAGPIMVNVNNSEVALSRGMAKKVLVQLL